MKTTPDRLWHALHPRPRRPLEPMTPVGYAVMVFMCIVAVIGPGMAIAWAIIGVLWLFGLI